MGDTSPGATTAANPTQQRTFFSSTSANDFLDRLQVILAEQHAQTQDLIAQLGASQQASMAALNTTLERLVRVILPPGSPQGSTMHNPNGAQRVPPPIPERPSTDGPASPHRSQYRTPPPPLPPARETTAFTVAETAASTFVGNSSGIKLQTFYGNDGEDVIAWLDQAERYFRLKDTPDNRKVDLVSFSLEDGARSFFHYCFIKNNRVELTWDQFKHAFTRKYDSPLMQNTLLRQKVKAIPCRHPERDMPNYCEKFRVIESHISHHENYYLFAIRVLFLVLF